MLKELIVKPAFFWQSRVRVAVPAFWLILGLGAILRLATLTFQSLWLDEGFSYWIANRSVADLLAYLPTWDTHPPLFYLITHWMIGLGGSEWLLRLPSALAGVASIGLIYALGVELFDSPSGVLAALLLAISPLHIWYSQEARMYALVSAFVLAAALFAVRALRTNSWVDWLALGICEGLSLWTDTAAIWFVVALNVSALVILPALWRSDKWGGWTAGQTLALVMYLPWVPSFLAQLHRGVPGWIPPATFVVVARTIADLATAFERTTLEALLALALLCLVPLIAAKPLIRDVRARRSGYLLLACWFVVPVGFAFLISQPYVRLPLLSLLFEPGHSPFLTRNLIVASFPLSLILARSLALIAPRPRTLLLVVLIGLCGVAYAGNNLTERKADYRAAFEIVSSRAAPSDLILLAPPYLEFPFAYYQDPQLRGIPLENVQDGVIQASNLQVYSAPLDALGNHRRVWLVSSYNVFQPDTTGTTNTLAKEGKLIGSWQVQELHIQLYEVEKSG